jgi:hypothetical protein
MPENEEAPLTGTALIKEVCRLIRLARARWDAHDNGGTRRERSRALKLYLTLTEEQKDEIPQPLRVWLRYRSVKYFAHKKNKPKKKKQSPPKKGVDEP